MTERHSRRWPAAAAVVVLMMGAAAVFAAQRLSVLVLDLDPLRSTLVVQRTPGVQMGVFDTETTLCARQKPGSPLFSVMLPPTFCPPALPGSRVLAPQRVLLRLPFSPQLHRLLTPEPPLPAG